MKQIVLSIMLFFAVAANAVPAFPGLINFRQPNDGGTVSIYLKGDERVHWAETKDGYSLMHRNDGSLVFAMQGENGDMLPSPYLAADKEQRSPEVEAFLSTIPLHLHYSQQQVESLTSIWKEVEKAKKGPKYMSDVIGTKKFLLILFEFNDKHFSHNANEFEALMNQVNYTADGRTGSVRDYYYDVSGGLFTLSMDVVGPFRGASNTAFYGNTDYGYQYFAREAVDSAAKYVDFSNYDNDGDGYIDGLHIIFAGHGEEAGASADHIWSHKSNIWNAPTYNNTVVDVYSCSPECSGNSGNNMTHIGVVCHELGHVFGAPDYYDTDYSGSGGEFPGLGEWDIMSGGSWNFSGAAPAHHNPYTKIYVYKWATCNTITATAAQYILDPVAMTNDDFYRVNTSTNGDFFLIENRQKIKWDKGIPGHGMLVYHVHPNANGASVQNYRHPQQIYILAYSTEQYPNDSPSSYGSVNSEYATFPGGTLNRDSLTDNSTPWFRPWSKQPNNLPFYNISDDPRTGKLFFSVQDVSPDPISAMAEGIDTDKILLTWERYGTLSTLILRSDNPNTFATPTSDMREGDTLDNGNIVCYLGSSYTALATGLEQNVHHYFKLFTKKRNGSFSDGIVIDGATLNCPATEWRTEDFENASINSLPDCWSGDWVTSEINGQKSLVSPNNTTMSIRDWSQVTCRPIMFDTTLTRVFQYSIKFLEGCNEETRLNVEYQENAFADWVVIDSVVWDSSLNEWNDRYLLIDNIGNYSRLRFKLSTDGSDRAAIDNIGFSDGWLINCTKGAGGDIEPLGYSVVYWNDSIEYIIRPHEGYDVHRLTYDSRVILPSRLTPRGDGSFSYKVGESSGSHIIHAAFKRNLDINEPAINNITIYPNPTNGILNVNCTTGSTIKIYDTRGCLVISQIATEETTTIDMQNMPKGIYIMQCGKNVKKIVKK